EKAAVDPGDRHGATLTADLNALAQDVGTVRRQKEPRLDEVVHGARRVAVSFQADGVDAGVGSAAAGHLREALQDVLAVVVNRFRLALRPREQQSIRAAVDGDDAFGPEEVRALDGKLADGAAAPDGDGIATLDVAVLGGHVAGRE